MERRELSNPADNSEASINMKSTDQVVDTTTNCLGESEPNSEIEPDVTGKNALLDETKTQPITKLQSKQPCVSEGTSMHTDSLVEKDMNIQKEGNMSSLNPAAGSNALGELTNVETAKVIEDAERKILNERIANELLHDTSGTYISSLSGRNIASGKLADIQAQIKSTMEKAFWDLVTERLAKNPPDYTQVVGLVKEVRDELDALVPQSWKQELHEAFDVELISQILDSGAKDVGYLGKLLDYALGLILKLEAPARDSETVSAHQNLVKELSSIVAMMDSDSNFSFALALVKGLRFILEQIQILKQDISVARIRAIAPLIKGDAGVDYMQRMFTLRHGSPSEAMKRLPKTVHWLKEIVKTIENEKEDYNNVVDLIRASLLSSHSENLPQLSNVDHSSGCLTQFLISIQNSSKSEVSGLIQGGTPLMSSATLVRLGLLQLATSMVAANIETTPETFELNIERIKNAQNDFQRIIVIATSLLLARQTLSEKGVSHKEVDDILHKASKQLDDILTDPFITIHHVGQLLAKLCFSHVKDEADVIDIEFMTRVLNRSLSPEDIVFAKVMNTVKATLQTILLLERNMSLSLVETLLKRIGAGYLSIYVQKLAGDLDVMASISCRIHGQWYDSIILAVNG